jgi:glycosyltransferase involved in cell wall biosynthesis
MVEHEGNGYLAAPLDTDDFAKGIAWVLEDAARWRALSAAARRKVEQEFELSMIARRYKDLYETVLHRADRISEISLPDSEKANTR